MAIPADTIWEVNAASGSDTLCGGGWSNANKGATGVDYSTFAGAKYTYTSDVSCAASTTVTSAGSLFTNDILGNAIQANGNIGIVTAFTSSSSITVAWTGASPTFSGVTGYIGGGLATPGKANTVAVAGNLVYIKAGTYAVGASIQNDAAVTWIGYNTTRTPFNTDTTLPLLQASAGSLSNGLLYLHAGAAGNEARNLAFDNNGNTLNNGLVLGHVCASARRCKAVGFVNGFLTNWNQNTLDDCYAEGCTTNGFNIGGNSFVQVTGCIASGGATGFSTSTTAASFVDCLATGCSSHGFTLNVADNQAVNCTAYGCGGDGIKLNNVGVQARNCVSYGNTGYAFNGALTTNHARLIKCAGDAGGAGQTNALNSWEVEGLITLTAAPFTNSAGNDYSLNSTAGGGAACKQAGLPSAMLGISTTAYPDLGAVQSSTAASGGCPHLAGEGGGLAG